MEDKRNKGDSVYRKCQSYLEGAPGRLGRPPGWRSKAALLQIQRTQGTVAFDHPIILLFQADLQVWGGRSGALKCSDNQEKEGVLN